MTKSIAVYLADDQADIRSALQLLIEQEPETAVAGEARNAVSLIKGVCCTATDIVLLDWELPGLEMFEGGIADTVRQHRPNVKIVALSSRPGAKDSALAAGADLFVSKGDAPEVLLAALRKMVAGIEREEDE